MPRIFVAQTLVDRWLAEGVIQLDGELLRLSSGGAPTSLFITPAVWFQQVDGDDPDPYQVVGCVKSSVELVQMGAEHFDTSVVLGDLAYTVEPFTLAATGAVAVRAGAQVGSFTGVPQANSG